MWLFLFTYTFYRFLFRKETICENKKSYYVALSSENSHASKRFNPVSSSQSILTQWDRGLNEAVLFKIFLLLAVKLNTSFNRVQCSVLELRQIQTNCCSLKPFDTRWNLKKVVSKILMKVTLGKTELEIKSCEFWERGQFCLDISTSGHLLLN